MRSLIGSDWFCSVCNTRLSSILPLFQSYGCCLEWKNSVRNAERVSAIGEDCPQQGKIVLNSEIDGVRNGGMVSEIQNECLQLGNSVRNRGIDGVRNGSRPRGTFLPNGLLDHSATQGEHQPDPQIAKHSLAPYCLQPSSPSNDPFKSRTKVQWVQILEF